MTPIGIRYFRKILDLSQIDADLDHVTEPHATGLKNRFDPRDARIHLTRKSPLATEYAGQMHDIVIQQTSTVGAAGGLIFSTPFLPNFAARDHCDFDR